jgi:hypothetical protein
MKALLQASPHGSVSSRQKRDFLLVFFYRKRLLFKALIETLDFRTIRWSGCFHGLYMGVPV